MTQPARTLCPWFAWLGLNGKTSKRYALAGQASPVVKIQSAPTLYDISDEIGKEFGETISIVKAAEILELVDTPKQDVRFTDLGKKFVAVRPGW